ncbi:TPA: hypothetical protein ACPHOX_000972 [Haemophilus influenzae]|nr:hypothetical protein [Haemophilus influenzae]
MPSTPAPVDYGLSTEKWLQATHSSSVLTALSSRPYQSAPVLTSA